MKAKNKNNSKKLDNINMYCIPLISHHARAQRFPQVVAEDDDDGGAESEADDNFGVVSDTSAGAINLFSTHWRSTSACGTHAYKSPSIPLTYSFALSHMPFVDLHCSFYGTKSKAYFHKILFDSA